MIECYKILNSFYDLSLVPTLTLSTTSLRGHALKLFKNRALHEFRKHSFNFRIVDTWNSLPADVVCANNLNTFKNKLDNFWSNHPAKFYFESIWNLDIFEQHYFHFPPFSHLPFLLLCFGLCSVVLLCLLLPLCFGALSCNFFSSTLPLFSFILVIFHF